VRATVLGLGGTVVEVVVVVVDTVRTTAASAEGAAISELIATRAAPRTPAVNFVVMTLLPKNVDGLNRITRTPSGQPPST
jgi:hypothetical protein